MVCLAELTTPLQQCHWHGYQQTYKPVAQSVVKEQTKQTDPVINLE